MRPDVSGPNGSARSFVQAYTTQSRAPLVPELELYLATELTPLWHATSELLADHDPLPFWAFAWPGSQALARLCLDRPAIVRGRRVLDFAAGSGLAAIAAMRAGAASALAADVDAFFAAAVELNAALNGVRVDTTSRDLLGEPLDDIDVVLAGDIFYERDMAERAMRWFRRLTADGKRVLVGDPGRIYSPRAGLVEVARFVVPTSRELEDGDERVTVVAEITT